MMASAMAAVAIILFTHVLQRYPRHPQEGLETLRALSWQDFERLVGEAYRRRGYTVEETGGSSPDGEVDLVLYTGGRKTIVQCKRWRVRST
jgi:restriction system protein